jgi:tripartite-type tricarboxylate transporter receptor subunit TctC
LGEAKEVKSWMNKISDYRELYTRQTPDEVSVILDAYMNKISSTASTTSTIEKSSVEDNSATDAAFKELLAE